MHYIIGNVISVHLKYLYTIMKIIVFVFKVGMDKAIGNLTTPLEHLKEEIMVCVYMCINYSLCIPCVNSLIIIILNNFFVFCPFLKFKTVKTAMEDAILAVEEKLKKREQIRQKKVHIMESESK